MFSGPTRETVLAYNSVKKKRDDLRKNESDRTGKIEIRTGKKFLAAGEAYMAIFRPTRL